MTVPVLIAPFQTGLDTDVSPWLAPLDSFRKLNNFHVKHGYIEKRAGRRKFAYMAHNRGTLITGITNANPAVVTSASHGIANGQQVLISGVQGMTEVNGNTYTAANVTANTLELSGTDSTAFGTYTSGGGICVYPAGTITGITQANPAVVTASNNFQNGDEIIITNVSGMTEVNGLIFTVANATATDFELSGIDSTGYTAYSAGGNANYFTADRIMGIYRYFSPDGTKKTLAFDTTNAAIYDGTNDRFNPLDANDIMSGSDTDYLWVENWQHSNSTNRMYFSNGKAFDGVSLDGIRYYDESVSTNSTTIFAPSLGGTRTLYGTKLIFAIKQRLVCLNVYEYDSGTTLTVNYPQRARWCQAQGPSNWDDTVAGGGGFVDAPTGEQIISARALQDVIIVFFTNSVWTLRPVPDPALPFRWDRINDFRACDGKMATVQYDRYVAALGVRGITATDGVETKRIDDRIQDFTSDEVNVDEFQKVFCLRNFDSKRWWTLYPNNEDEENSKALILDEDSVAFSEYDVSMNCLGYGNFEEDYGLDDFVAAGDLDLSLNDFDDETLQSFFWQDNQEAFLGGSIDGIVYVMETEATDDGDVISCDLYTNAWNPFQQEGKEAQLNYLDIYVLVEKRTQITVEFYKDSDTTPYATRQSDILPPLGFIASVSNITQANPAQVTAAQHGLSTGDTVYIYGVQGMQDIDGGYTITVVDANNFTLDGIDSTGFDAFTTGGQVVHQEYYRTKSWKRILAGGIGFQHRVRITSTGINSPLRIEGFKPHFRQRGGRTIN